MQMIDNKKEGYIPTIIVDINIQVSNKEQVLQKIR